MPRGKAGMAKNDPIVDRRLLGYWKSDATRTFQGHIWRKDSTAKSRRFMRAIFGKLVVHWTPTRVTCYLEGDKNTNPYRILASDATSAAVLISEDTIMHIHFEGDDYYRLYLPGYVEYFRKIETPSKAALAKK